MATFRDCMLKINRKFADKTVIIAAIFALVFQFGFPNGPYEAFAGLNDDRFILFPNTLPLVEDKELKLVQTVTVPVTAYNSLPKQTDNTPCYTANGFNLCEHNTEDVIAANFLPFGTKVKFPEYDPHTIYTVQDRMNARYYHRADIWKRDYDDAVRFGQKTLTMEIYEYES